MVEHVLPDLLEHALEESVDALAVDERRLDVDLGELHLAVGTEILVAETTGDLKIFFHPRHHEDLLELLRRLRERVELAGMNARRHEVFARTFRGALKQGGRFDLDEFLRVEVVAHSLGGAMAGQEILAHLRPAQVEVAVGQAQVLVDLVAAGVGQRERRGVGNVVDHEFARIDLHLARRQVLVHHVRRAQFDFPRNPDDRLILEVGGLGAALGVEFDLRHTLPVAQVDKDDAAVVADGVDPAGKRDRGVEVGLGELGAVMGAFHGT